MKSIHEKYEELLRLRKTVADAELNRFLKGAYNASHKDPSRAVGEGDDKMRTLQRHRLA